MLDWNRRDSVARDTEAAAAIGHGWDLARATGQPWDPDPQTCQHALTVLEGVIQPEYRGPGMPFGPEVAIEASAPPLDRLLAFTGRDPKWA